MIRYVSISKSYLMIHPDTLTLPQITLILYGAQSSSHLDSFGLKIVCSIENTEFFRKNNTNSK